MEFEHIYWAIIPLLVATLWAANYWNIFKKPELYLPPNFTARSILVRRIFLFLIGLTAWLFISFAITGPRKPLAFAKHKIEVNDIFFVVDVSRSMEARDFLPNRLEAAKEKILDFVQLRPTDRIGLIMFSEKVFTLLPLTTDLDLIKQMVGEIQMGFLGSGTNIGDALGLAVGRAKQSLAKSKIIVLLTDGVSNVGSMTPEQAAEEAVKSKVKVYTIGIGRNINATIGQGTSRQNIPGGSIDMETLKMISDKTNGKSYVASDPNALKSVLQEINELEKTSIDKSAQIVYEELYWSYLLIGVCLIILVEIMRKLLMREGV